MSEKGGLGWKRLLGNASLRRRLQIRAELVRSVRDFFDQQGFLEIDVPTLVPLPGMEPHLRPIRVPIHDARGKVVPFYLHTSPEYALKKMLAAGYRRIYSLTHAFRDGEISATHNLEFTLLEWYRAGESYTCLMQDCEELFVRLVVEGNGRPEVTYRGTKIDLSPPWPRLSVAEATREFAGIEITGRTSLEELVEVARRKGYTEARRDWPWDDLFFLIFLNEVEPRFPRNRPLFLTDYPVQLGALARRKPEDPFTVERFELYIGGLELANAFSELTDPAEQKVRLEQEQDQRRRLGQDVYPVDNSFLEALEMGLPESAGIALGVDRLVMLLTDAPKIEDVLPFPTRTLLEDFSKSRSIQS